MPPREYQSDIVRSLLREIVSNKILSPSLELCDQKWVNKMVRFRFFRELTLKFKPKRKLC